MPSVGFEPTISAGERPQTYALDRAATGTGAVKFRITYYLTDLQIRSSGMMMAPLSVTVKVLQRNYSKEEMLFSTEKNRPIVGGRYFREYGQRTASC